jgi:hypothetical protein
MTATWGHAAPRLPLPVSPRDTAILAHARRRLPRGFTFADAVAALLVAVEAMIPSGRLFELAIDETGPVIGSIISGVGLRAAAGGVEVVRVTGADTIVLDRWSR